MRYPGLGLRHPDWNNLRASWDVSYYDNMTYVAATMINIPVEDPGIYDFSMGGRTSGTAYSGSQPFGFTGDFAVQTHAPSDLVFVSVCRRGQRLLYVPDYCDPGCACGLIVSFVTGSGGSPAIGFPTQSRHS